MSGRYEVEFERSATKELDRLDGPIRARVLRKVAPLADDPRPLGWSVPTICGAFGSGTTASSYTIEDDRLVVIVVRVAGRGKVYRDI